MFKSLFSGGPHKLDEMQNKEGEGDKHHCPLGASNLPQVKIAFCGLFTIFLEGYHNRIYHEKAFFFSV